VTENPDVLAERMKNMEARFEDRISALEETNERYAAYVSKAVWGVLLAAGAVLFYPFIEFWNYVRGLKK
jgi:hypothetical protein